MVEPCCCCLGTVLVEPQLVACSPREAVRMGAPSGGAARPLAVVAPWPPSEAAARPPSEVAPWTLSEADPKFVLLSDPLLVAFARWSNDVIGYSFSPLCGRPQRWMYGHPLRRPLGYPLQQLRVHPLRWLSVAVLLGGGLA